MFTAPPKRCTLVTMPVSPPESPWRRAARRYALRSARTKTCSTARQSRYRRRADSAAGAGPRAPTVGPARRPAARDRRGAPRARPSTPQHDARRTDVRALTYRWHPLYGREFVVRAYGRGELVRCVVVDDPSGASIVLPQWMFDPVACAAMRGTSEASVSIAALEDLRRLLLDAHA